MQFNMIHHPTTPPAHPPFKVWADVEHVHILGATASAKIWFCVSAPVGRFVIPEPQEPARADGLWRTTCFEMFLKQPGDDAYREWNFAPSGAWAAFDFSGYREGMAEAEVGSPPYIRMEDNLTWWSLGATITVDADQRWR
ncbi:MAG: hypothetical protein M3428_03090, partial [Pseudomonadota bacterium]|nr:hypothetical protein [Pseudomonadota bacterium]